MHTYSIHIHIHSDIAIESFYYFAKKKIFFSYFKADNSIQKHKQTVIARYVVFYNVLCS